MDYDQHLLTLLDLRKKHLDLAEEAEVDSVERVTHTRIVELFDGGIRRADASQRARHVQTDLNALAQIFEPSSGRKIMRAALRELEEMADLEPVRVTPRIK